MTIEARIRQVDELLLCSSVSLSSFQPDDLLLAHDLCKRSKLHFGTLVRRASAIAQLQDTSSLADRLREAAQHLIFLTESPDSTRTAVSNILSLSAGITTAEFCAAIEALPERLGCTVEQKDDGLVLARIGQKEYVSTEYRSSYGFRKIVLMDLESLIQRRRPAWAVGHCPTTWFRRPIDTTDYVPDVLVSASWQFQTRECPRCKFRFESNFDSGQCEACGASFFASDIYGPHNEIDVEEMLRVEAVDFPNFYEIDAKRLEEMPPLSPNLEEERLWYEQFFRRRIANALDDGAELYYWREVLDRDVCFDWLYAVKYCRIVERMQFQLTDGV